MSKDANIKDPGAFLSDIIRLYSSDDLNDIPIYFTRIYYLNNVYDSNGMPAHCPHDQNSAWNDNYSHLLVIGSHQIIFNQAGKPQGIFVRRYTSAWGDWQFTPTNLRNSLVYETYTITVGDIEAGSYKNSVETVTKDGYYPIGIVGYTLGGNGYSWCFVPQLYLSNTSLGSGKINWMVRNSNTSKFTGGTLSVRVLWSAS